MKNTDLRKLCVAPMMGYTTPHARKLYRILSKRAFLFSEMIPSNTLIYSKNRDLIIENEKENPVALQVGGAELQELGECAKIAKTYNYDEINLNVGCPSKAVQKGNFGACLMKDSILVRNCLEKMIESTNIEVTMKCRIGIGEEFNYDFFCNFINEVIKSGIKIVYVHARNAILGNLSPKNNRTIPPLNYEFVNKIKKEYPNISFILNGGIESIENAYSLSKIYDGVMLGRLIQNNPFCLLKIDKLFFNQQIDNTLYQKIISEYFQYIKKRLKEDSIFRLFSPLINIFFGMPNSNKFKNDIQTKMKNYEIDKLETLFLQFIKNKQML